MSEREKVSKAIRQFHENVKKGSIAHLAAHWWVDQCESLLREVEELEKKCEELRFGKGVHWPDDIRAELGQVKADRDSLKAKLERVERTHREYVASSDRNALSVDTRYIKVRAERDRLRAWRLSIKTVAPESMVMWADAKRGMLEPEPAQEGDLDA